MASMQSSTTKIKMKTFETLSGAAIMKMEPEEIAALSRDELVRLAFRVKVIMTAILTYIKAVEETTEAVNFDIQREAELLSMKPQDIAALSKDELEQQALSGQKILQRCPIKPGCRFCSLPDEYYLHLLLEWLTIEDQARFDMALLNRMDRRAHLHLLRDTEHGGVLSVSGKNEDGYKFGSGVVEWLESRNVFMRALTFYDKNRDIPAGFLARTGRQLLKLDLSECQSISDAELGKLFARCPRLEEVTLLRCSDITDAALECLVQRCPGIHTLVLHDTKVTDAGLAILAEGYRNMKKIGLGYLAISDAGLGKIAEMCPRLENVDLSGCSDITDEGVSRLHMRCLHVHTLALSQTQIAGEGLARLADGWKEMKTLYLFELAISDAGLGEIAERCPNLEEVHLGGCRSITDVGISSLVKHCPRLHAVYLWGTVITGEGLTRLGDSWKDMKTLDLRHTAITDAGLGKIAAMCPALEEVHLSRCSDLTDVGLSSLAKNCQHIHTLDLSHTKFTGEGLARLGAGWKDMKTLDLSHSATSDAGLGKIAEMCPHLEEVNIGFCSGITDVGLSSLAVECPHIHGLVLEHTQITGKALDRHGDGWRNMKELNLHGSAISDAGLGKIAKMCPNLEGVDFCGCRSITDKGLSKLVRYCPKLRKLNLSYTQITGQRLVRHGDGWRNMKTVDLCKLAISDAGLGKIAEVCPNLEAANLLGCESVTDAGLLSLVKSCPRVHTLALWGTQITDEGLARLGGSWRNMRKLNLWELAITDAGLGTIAEMCPDLEVVDVNKCRSISDEGVSNLAQFCPELRTLDLSGTRATAEGVASLRVAYPALDVTFHEEEEDEEEEEEEEEEGEEEEEEEDVNAAD